MIINIIKRFLCFLNILSFHLQAEENLTNEAKEQLVTNSANVCCIQKEKSNGE